MSVNGLSDRKNKTKAPRAMSEKAKPTQPTDDGESIYWRQRLQKREDRRNSLAIAKLKLNRPERWVNAAPRWHEEGHWFLQRIQVEGRTNYERNWLGSSGSFGNLKSLKSQTSQKSQRRSYFDWAGRVRRRRNISNWK